jgi:Mg2+ and Co2+ transporter CorA
MNVTPPMSDSVTLWPFFGLVSLSIILSACFYAYFRSLKYI